MKDYVKVSWGRPQQKLSNQRKQVKKQEQEQQQQQQQRWNRKCETCLLKIAWLLKN